MMKFIPTFGAEIEKPVSNLSSKLPHKTSQGFFQLLFQQAGERNGQPTYHKSDIEKNTITSVTSKDLGDQGIDNGFNLLETASAVHRSLSDLNMALITDLALTNEALWGEGATIINSSIHPLGRTNMDSYRHFVAPKGVYSYIWHRGWNHAAGIDAKAQNSPATSVKAKDAAKAVSVIIGIGAAVVALTANSPFANGKKTKYKESRLTIWNEMFKTSKVKSDLRLSQFPTEPFQNLAEYFGWMFGGNSAIHFVIRSNSDGYKGVGDSILIPKAPISVLEYLSRDKMETRKMTDIKNGFSKKIHIVKPAISDLEMMQWSQFTGARIRFKLIKHDSFPLKDFLAECRAKSNNVESIFEKFAEYVYIEGRDPGANFPDKTTQDAGEEIANSVLIAPSALQAGIIQNLEKVYDYLMKIGWENLGELRNEAIIKGLDGEFNGIKVRDFTEKILHLAHEGLNQNDQKHLAYFDWVTATGQNGADRALKFYNSKKNSTLSSLVGHLEVKI